MTEPDDPLPNSERSDATGSWAIEIPSGMDAPKPLDAPTVRSSNSGSSLEIGSRVSVAATIPLPRAGEQVDSFEIQESIGIGGMGAVFRARDMRLDRLVALKILAPDQSNDSDSVQRFYQEGRAAARLDHENIARVFTIGHDSRHHYIAFEFIEGTTIRQRVTERKGPLTVTEAINYTLQIADALVHACDRGVVHRDIKPSNIIITPQGRAKLVDMGLARRFESGVDDGLTQSGMTLGTFDYISPEQARDPRSVDVRSDLYSLGCTLFYMLAGRPPFPDGTVLQKLLQHQEEAPPDLREINPEVTRELAAIVVKLMAKDRERRYQTPEQLARDLLTVAGSMRLRSLSPEGLIWMAPAPPVQPAWERHLIWVIPALAFVLIVGVLIWTGQEIGRAGGTATTGPASKDRPDASAKDQGSARFLPAADRPSSDLSSPAPKIVPEIKEPLTDDESLAIGFPEEIPPGGMPQTINVDSTEDLLAIILKSPRRATLVLTDEGPYRIRGGFNDADEARSRLTQRDLTIKAQPGVRPVVKFVPASTAAQGALLDFAGGKVVIEGIEFSLETSGGASIIKPTTAIRAEDTELTLRRCLFRRVHSSTSLLMSDPRASAIRVINTKANPADGDRPPSLILDHCHFDGEQVGILATGPIDLNGRDCTIASQPAVWLDDVNADRLVDSDLTFRHVSFLAGETSVFRFNGSAVRVQIDDSVIAPSGEALATVVAETHPESLLWKGRGNLYARIATFLLPIGNIQGQAAIRDSAEWAETNEIVRERGSRFLESSIWDDSRVDRPARSGRAPAITFHLASNLARTSDVGARESLTEPLAMADQLLAGRERATRKPSATSESSKAAEVQSKSPAGSALARNNSGTPGSNPISKPGTQDIAAIDTESTAQKLSPMPMPMPMPMPTAADAEPIADMPIMPQTAEEGGVLGALKDVGKAANNAAPGDPVRADPGAIGERLTKPKPESPVTGKGDVPPSVNDDSTILRSSDQLQKALSEASSRGGVLLVAADADWDLPETLIRVEGSWRIQAVSGTTRPKLRFLPAASTATKPASSWKTMFDLRAGSLHLDGFDIILPRSNAPTLGGWGAFAISRSTDLGLSNCTVTIEGDQVPSAVVAAGDLTSLKEPVAPDRGLKDEHPENAPAATVRFQNCLLRAGGDVFQIQGGRWIVLDLDNVVVSTTGSLLHARGSRRGDSPETIALTLRSVTSRNVGGLVFLESSADDPELPVAQVNVRDSILATNSQGGPLLRVDGQETMASLRDQIVWEGLRVGYHKISIYRRDQSSQFGTVPSLYDRQSWTVAVGLREMNSVHGDMIFRRSWEASQPAWTFRTDDAEIDAESPASSSGPVLSRVPKFNSAP